jgi:hypothetical protein
MLADVAGFYFYKWQAGGIGESATQASPIPADEEVNEDITQLPTDSNDELLTEENESETAVDDFDGLQQNEAQVVLPALEDSDGLIREAIAQISPTLGQWLKTDQLIRKFVLIANDFSQGLRLEKHMRFLKPDQPFAAEIGSRRMFIATKSYQRYDKLAAAIDALDINATLAVYKKFRPLMVQVFNEFSYPEQYGLEDIFTKAAAEILAAPVIEGRIALTHPTVNYKFADPKLEALGPVHKQMIRMGPTNTVIIQTKVRALLEGLVNLQEMQDG